VGRIVEGRLPKALWIPRVRRSVSLFNGTRREKTMMIGAPAGSIDTAESFLLASGRPLSGAEVRGETRGNTVARKEIRGNTAAREVLLTQEQARNLKVVVGDRVTIVSKNREGRNTALDFTVAGIGDFVMLSLFSYKACFVDIDSARELVGLQPGEATDIIITLEKKEAALGIARELARECEAYGIPSVVQADERFLSEDLSSEEGLLPSQKKKPEKIRFSTWQDMGKTFRGIGEAIFLMLAALAVVLLLIVSILIGNLVTLMGIERFRDIGTLRGLGFDRGMVTRLFMGEILGITGVSAAAGAAIGSGLVFLLGRAGLHPPVPALEFIMGKALRPILSPGWVAGLPVAVAVFAFAASSFPARRACAVAPAEAMRDIQGGAA
jgi:putative ABC transport system permease protein